MATIVLADDDADLRAVYATCPDGPATSSWRPRDGREAVDLAGRSGRTCCCWTSGCRGLNGLEVLDALRNDPAATRMRVADALGAGRRRHPARSVRRRGRRVPGQGDRPGRTSSPGSRRSSPSRPRALADARMIPCRRDESRPRRRRPGPPDDRRLPGQPRLPLRPAQLRAGRRCPRADGRPPARPDAPAPAPPGRPAGRAADRPRRRDQGQGLDRRDDRRGARRRRASGPACSARRTCTGWRSGSGSTAGRDARTNWSSWSRPSGRPSRRSTPGDRPGRRSRRRPSSRSPPRWACSTSPAEGAGAVVLEVGMGGRLDSTNVVRPVVVGHHLDLVRPHAAARPRPSARSPARRPASSSAAGRPSAASAADEARAAIRAGRRPVAGAAPRDRTRLPPRPIPARRSPP